MTGDQLTIYDQWKDEGTLTDLEAIHALCMEIGENQNELEILSNSISDNIKNLREQLFEIMKHHGDAVHVKGFGDIEVVPPSETVKYDRKMMDKLVHTLIQAGDKFTADMISACKVKSYKRDYLKITREGKNDK